MRPQSVLNLAFHCRTGLNGTLVKLKTHLRHLIVRILASTSVPFRTIIRGANAKFSTNGLKCM
jgi:hypothetical protein